MLVLSMQTLFWGVFVAFLSIPRAVGSVLCVACVWCDRFCVDGDFGALSRARVRGRVSVRIRLGPRDDSTY